MLRLNVMLTLIVSLGVSVACAGTTPVTVPTFPAYHVTLSQFDAVADGQTDNTQAFAQAIEAVTLAGGGRLVVPAGIWRTIRSAPA